MRNLNLELGCLCVLIVVVLSQISDAHQEAISSVKLPEKPPVFKNKQELYKYIKQINEYYGIVGRPRFGKRTYVDEVEPEQIGLSEELNSDEDNDSTLKQEVIKSLRKSLKQTELSLSICLQEPMRIYLFKQKNVSQI